MTKSPVWRYFDQRTVDGVKIAKCSNDKCAATAKDIPCKGGSTSGLLAHLKSHHPTDHKIVVLAQEKKKEEISKSVKRKRDDNILSTQLKQPRVDDALFKSVKYAPDHPIQKEFDSLVLDLIIDAFLSFNVVKRPTFKNLIEFCNKKFIIKHPTTFSRQVDDKYNVVLGKVMNIIRKNIQTSCAFTSDLWTSRADDSYISLTIHYIDEQFRLHRWTPFCQYLKEESHTGENICSYLTDMTDDINIPDKVQEFCVTDNAANMKLAVRSSELCGYPCNNHTLQLAIKDAFDRCDGMNNALLKCKDIASLLHRSPKTQKSMTNFCEKFEHNPNQIPQQNDTRWNSELSNIKGVRHHRKCLEAMANDDLIDTTLVPSISEWKMIEGAVEILSPFEKTTKIWEQEMVTTLNTVGRCLYEHIHNLNDYTTDAGNKGFGVTFAKELMKRLKVRFPSYGFTIPENCFANFLDPTLKGIHLKEESLYENTIDNLERSAATLGLIQKLVNEHDDSQQQTTETLSAIEMLKRKYAKQKTISELSAVKKESKHYEDYPYATSDEDVLKWWKARSEVFPVLSSLARHYLCVPAASSKSERVFSTAGNIVTQKRTRLNAEKVEKMVVLKENMFRIDEYDM